MSDNKKVLIVDDEPDIIEMLETMLAELGFITTMSAHDGISGLIKAKEQSPDLIILDVMMPGKNGFEVFAELKNESITKNIPVIMLTSVSAKTNINFSAKDMGEFLGTTPDAYIEKPVDTSTLHKTVINILE